MEKSKEIFCAIKRVIVAVVVRNRDLSDCCPSYAFDDESALDKLKKLTKSQQDVDSALQDLRAAAGSNLKAYSNAEILILAHMIAGIWSSEGSLSIDSRSILDIVGSNRVEDAGELIVGLLNRKSPIFRFISIAWEDGRRRMGSYALSVHDSQGLHKLFLGKLISED